MRITDWQQFVHPFFLQPPFIFSWSLSHTRQIWGFKSGIWNKWLPPTDSIWARQEAWADEQQAGGEENSLNCHTPKHLMFPFCSIFSIKKKQKQKKLRQSKDFIRFAVVYWWIEGGVSIALQPKIHNNHKTWLILFYC